MIALRRAASVPFVAASIAATTLALVLAVGAIAGAVKVDPPPQPASEPPIHFAMLQGGARTPGSYIDEAVAAAPFAPSREVVQPLPEPEGAVVAQSSALQLMGTVVGGDGDSFVLLALSGEPAKVARVGDVVGGYLLKSIGQGSAVLTAVTDGKRIELRVPRSR